MQFVINFSLCYLICLLWNTLPFGYCDSSGLYVSTNEDSTTNAIEGFGTDLQCVLNTCITPNVHQVKWYKDNVVIANGLNVTKERFSIKHNVILDPNKDCSGKCSRNQDCAAEQYCLEPSCCQCNGEEFTLVITNLSLTDSGTYRCSLEPNGNHVEIRLTIMEGGSFPSFNQNLTFDHSKCCEDQHMSTDCLPMCKPRILETRKFDPVPCQKEFSKLLNCATVGGNVSHIHCCRLSFVPPFCWEFCSGRSNSFQKSNRLCVYWMPEIFQCYEQAYLPYPGPPEHLTVNSVNASSLEACWEQPKVRGETVNFYSVRYQEVPRFPFLGGGIPFLTGDLDSPTDGDVTETPVDEEIPGGRRPLIFPASSSGGIVQPNFPILTNRRKRQALIISTHNFATNETEIREFKYLEVNTSNTCETLVNLKPTTQYFVYVTATNNYGTSLPSLRQTAVTESAVYPNVTLPNVAECCVKAGVEQDCAKKMCNVENPPTSAGAFNLAFTCRKEFPKVAPCLADGRDHSECCKEKNVGGECLKFCGGLASHLHMTSVLCLSLDIQSIYTCYREGYLELPSPPVNVTASLLDSTSAEIRWDPSSTNAHKISNYSLFYKTDREDQYNEIKNAQSPYVFVNLHSDVAYSVYIVARGGQGSSLKSSVVRFFTKDKVDLDNLCRFGKPLKDAFDEPVICGTRVPCPPLFSCVDSDTDDSDKMYCCPTESFSFPSHQTVAQNLTSCCIRNAVPSACMKLCTYNVTARDLTISGPSCVEHIKTFIDCGGDFRNDRPCCVKAGVEGVCLDFCEPPLEHVTVDYVPCVKYAEKIVKCGLDGVLKLPGQPKNLRLVDSGYFYATLAWDAPVQPLPVTNYELRIFELKRNLPLSFNTSGLSLTVPDLNSNAQYVANVVSWNKYGSSMPGENLTFALRQGGPSSGDDDLKPRPPTSVEKAWYKQGSVNITWNWINLSVTGKPITSYQFRVDYKTHVADKQSTQWNNFTASNKSVLLTGLTSSMTYDVRVIAINLFKNVESVPSETINILAQENKEPSIQFRTLPDINFISGDKITVICSATGDPEPTVILEKSGKRLASATGNVSYVFQVALPEDGFEPVVCTANSGGIITRHREVLKIRYPPVVAAMGSPLTGIQDLSLKIVCQITAYPKADISWYFSTENSWKNVDKVKAGSQRLFLLEATDNENVFNSSVKINNVQLKDAGYYFCKAENSLGSSNATVKVTVEPFPVPKGPDYLLTCCQQEGVKPECLSACTSEINLQAYEQNPHCLEDFEKLFTCARDGVDDRRCCRLSNVPETCLPYCNGVFVDGDKLDMNCLNYRSQIVTCVQERHRYVSGPPEDFNVNVVNNKGSVNVTWKPPSYNNDSVQMYVVYYKKTGEQNYTEVRTDKTFAEVNGLEANSFYNFTVISVNHYGFSNFVPIVRKRISLNGDNGNGQESGFSGGSTSKPIYSGSSNIAGSVLGVIFCLLLAAVVVLVVIYFTRRPYKLPTFLLKLRSRTLNHHQTPTSDTVAFENPGYDREGQVRGLPGDGTSSNNGYVAASNGDTVTAGWENAHLETPEDSPAPEQKGMRYTQLT